MRYDLLTARNPDPEHDPRFLQRLQDLYEGGYTIQRRAGLYLPKALGETEKRYQERLSMTSYVSYLGQIVDSYVANLFAQDLSVQPASDASDPNTPGSLPDVDFYTDFVSNADLRGTPFANVVRGAFTNALVKRRAYLAIDFPATGVAAQSLADEDKVGSARGYAFEVPCEHLVDWCYSEVMSRRVAFSKDADDAVEFEVGRFAWVILRKMRQERLAPDQPRGKVVEEFKVWRRDADTGIVSWERYETRPYDPDRDPIKSDEDVPLVTSDVTSFREIPLIELCIPHGLWVGNKVGPLNEEHYRRRSILVEAMQLSLYEIPIAFLGGEGPQADGSIPSETSQDPNRAAEIGRSYRAQGINTLGAQDKFGYFGPSGVAYEPTNKQLQELVDEMHRTAHQMASSVSSTQRATGRSGASKQEDRHATLIILGALGAVVRDFARRAYRCLSEARNEDVIWDAHGLDKFDLWDRSELIAEAAQVGGILDQVKSRTLAVKYKSYLAERLIPNTPPETLQQIQREIDASTYDVQVLPADAPTGPAGASPTASATTAPTTAPSLAARDAARGTSNGKPLRGATAGSAAPSAPTLDDPDPHRVGDASSAGIAETVYRQLTEDYDAALLGWVRAAQWAGPVRVPVSSVDFSNRDNWEATYDKAHIQDFVDQIKATGETKPVILVNEPNNAKMIIADGHHRSLAYEKTGVDILAYVATVANVGGPWDDMHSNQGGGSKQGSAQTSMQRSAQSSAQGRLASNQTSTQK